MSLEVESEVVQKVVKDSKTERVVAQGEYGNVQDKVQERDIVESDGQIEKTVKVLDK